MADAKRCGVEIKKSLHAVLSQQAIGEAAPSRRPVTDYFSIRAVLFPNSEDAPSVTQHRDY